MQFHIWKNEGAEGPVIFCRDTIYLHHQNVGAEGPMLLFRRDISLYPKPPPPTSSTFAPVDLTAPKVAAGKKAKLYVQSSYQWLNREKIMYQLNTNHKD